MPPLAIGDPAPNFSAPAHDGSLVQLSDFVGKSPLVLFFYPKDGSPICTKEVCSFRDSYAKFVDAGAEVFGVSSDSEQTHRQFAEQQRLPFRLVTDADGKLRKAFGVSRTLGIIPGRATYVIDRAGMIRLIFSAQLASEEHVRRALAALSESSNLES